MNYWQDSASYEFGNGGVYFSNVLKSLVLLI